MGLTQAALTGILGLATSWLSTKIPFFSNLIALKKYKQLDTLFNKTIKQALAVMLACLAFLFIVLALMHYFQYYIVSRFLEPTPFIILGLSSVVLFLTNALAIYLRCHKKEPFLRLSIISATINAFLMFFASKYFGITGMVSGYFIVMLIVLIGGYRIFISRKKVWHNG
jgi:hypothetical protein